MLKPPKRSPVESPLWFEVDPEPAEDLITSLAGVSQVVETLRSLGLGHSANGHMAIKERQRGYDEGTYLESLVILNAAGRRLLGRFRPSARGPSVEGADWTPLPSPEAARSLCIPSTTDRSCNRPGQGGRRGAALRPFGSQRGWV